MKPISAGPVSSSTIVEEEEKKKKKKKIRDRWKIPHQTKNYVKRLKKEGESTNGLYELIGVMWSGWKINPLSNVYFFNLYC